MEFAAVNSPKNTAKTVAITLTADEAKNPANAFAALLNLGTVRFNAEHGLSQAEGQWMRTQMQRDTAPKPKPENEAKPKEKTAAADKPANDDKANAAATKSTSQKTEGTSSRNDNTAPVAAAQPTEQTAAVDLAKLDAIAIQFQIFMQMPDGSMEDMGTFDLKALMAAAAQDSSLASALEAAFGQVADSLATGETLLADLAQVASTDPAAAVDASAMQTSGEMDATDTMNAADLFKQIAAAFRPLAQQAANNPAVLTAQNAQAQVTDVNAEAATQHIQSPEAAEQSAELSRILGDENKIRIQVTVNGRTVADVPFEWSPFNRYAGYNPEAMRTASTANGQVGQGTATNTVTASPDGIAAQTAAANNGQAGLQTNLGASQNGATSQMRGDIAQVKAPDAPIQTTANTNSSTPSQPTSFASTLSQATGNVPTTPTSAAERPLPPQPQQVVEQIKVNITRIAKAGLDRVTIQLRPEELGRIEVKLELTQDGNVRANITADNPATLELLQREARGLERALQDAGLRADADNLEFNLRSEDQDRLAQKQDEREARQNAARQNGAQLGDAETEADDMYDYAMAASLRGGVDTYV